MTQRERDTSRALSQPINFIPILRSEREIAAYRYPISADAMLSSKRRVFDFNYSQSAPGRVCVRVLLHQFQFRATHLCFCLVLLFALAFCEGCKNLNLREVTKTIIARGVWICARRKDQWRVCVDKFAYIVI
jgi:hypothetical protein